MLDGITSCFNKAKVNIKNPFLSPSDIELALSSFVSPMKEVNNQVLFAAELKDIVENQPVNEKARKQSQAEYKYHPKTNQELRKLVSDENIKLSEIDISEVSDFSYLFECSNREDFSGIEDWDVSHVTNMSEMFSHCFNFNADILEWDVSSVTDMSAMFENAISFNQPLENWDVSSVTNMSNMFHGATNFNQPLNNWDVSLVTDMYCMFKDTKSFNQPLASWNVKNVTHMGDMFSGSAQNPTPSWRKIVYNFQ